MILIQDKMYKFLFGEFTLSKAEVDLLYLSYDSKTYMSCAVISRANYPMKLFHRHGQCHFHMKGPQKYVHTGARGIFSDILQGGIFIGILALIDASREYICSREYMSFAPTRLLLR